MSLHLDWCSHQAAKYAVEHWHYSRKMPVGKIVKIGAWEDGTYIGCVLFSRGANAHIGRPYNLRQTEVCELTRIALTSHRSPVSKIGSIAIKMLRAQSSGIRLIVSYADPSEGHHGGVYQAMGWVYTGHTSGTHMLEINGKRLHKREANARYGTNDSTILGGKYVYPEQKHRYLCPLDAAMRAQIAPLAQPYPKRPCAASIDGDAPGLQPGEGGSTPTAALHTEL